jgi:hypothetical protein
MTSEPQRVLTVRVPLLLPKSAPANDRGPARSAVVQNVRPHGAAPQLCEFSGGSWTSGFGGRINGSLSIGLSGTVLISFPGAAGATGGITSPSWGQLTQVDALRGRDQPVGDVGPRTPGSLPLGQTVDACYDLVAADVLSPEAVSP